MLPSQGGVAPKKSIVNGKVRSNTPPVTFNLLRPLVRFFTTEQVAKGRALLKVSQGQDHMQGTCRWPQGTTRGWTTTEDAPQGNMAGCMQQRPHPHSFYACVVSPARRSGSFPSSTKQPGQERLFFTKLIPSLALLHKHRSPPHFYPRAQSTKSLSLPTSD